MGLIQRFPSNSLAVAQTESGKVRGYIQEGVHTYKGIPYAVADRFEPPRPPEPWHDVRFMGYYGATCPLDFEPIAARGNGIGMFALQNDWGYPNENCHSLNVWTQHIGDNSRRPVMVWIHGGGYDYGSSHELPFYDGVNLSKTGDVVVVSVNHRLNILGFLDLSQYGDKYYDSANVGLLDLVASLEWVQRNIAEFGGDPDNVTLFGQSGGGGKITALLNSPVAKGLFKRAIIQSGSFASDILDAELAQGISAKVLTGLELGPEQVDRLQSIPYHDLLAAGNSAIAQQRQEAAALGTTINAAIWGPVRDDHFLPFGLFSPEATALMNDVTIMIGTTKTEFSGMASAATGEDMAATEAAIHKRYPGRAAEYIDALMHAYPGTTKPSDYLAIDFRFRAGAVRDANALVQNGHRQTYMYLFAWESPIDEGALKAMHCMELPFVFNNIHLGKELTGGGQEAHVLAKKVSAAWVSFTATGSPNAEGLPDWPVYTTDDRATMVFNDTSEVRHNHDRELLDIVGGDRQ